MFGYDWPRFHAAINDFPAALLVATVLFEFAAVIWKRESLKWAGVWTLWLGVIGGWIAVLAGEQAEDVIEHGAGIPAATMRAEMENRAQGHHHEPSEADEDEDEHGDSAAHHDSTHKH